MQVFLVGNCSALFAAFVLKQPQREYLSEISTISDQRGKVPYAHHPFPSLMEFCQKAKLRKLSDFGGFQLQEVRTKRVDNQIHVFFLVIV